MLQCCSKLVNIFTVLLFYFFLLFRHVKRYLRALYIDWSLVRRRVTWRLTPLYTRCNVLKLFCSYGFGNFFNLLMFSTVRVTCSENCIKSLRNSYYYAFGFLRIFYNKSYTENFLINASGALHFAKGGRVLEVRKNLIKVIMY